MLSEIERLIRAKEGITQEENTMSNRRNCIHHEDQVFAPKQNDDYNPWQQLAFCAPFLGFLVAGYVWMMFDLFS